ncbi:MAG: DUF4091 domain-containing protein [Sedimentisphaerales bacterium]|nr:DUF4091 domain-containing protein [Sedimentisphaerales bacterium]
MTRSGFLSAAVLIFLGLIFTGSGFAQGQPGKLFQVGFVDELEDLFPDSQVVQPAVMNFTVDVPRGGIAGVHILLTGLDAEKELSFFVEHAGKTVAAARWYRLVDVPVEENTGLAQRRGTDNPYVIRQAPFRVFDAVAPVVSPIQKPATTTALRVEIGFSESDAPGLRRYKIQLQQGQARQTLTLEVNVYQVVLPAVGKDSLKVTNWFNLDYIADNHEVQFWSEEHWAMISRYAELMGRTRQNVFWVPLSYVMEKQGEEDFVLNEARLERLVKVFSQAGLYYIEGGHVATRTNGDWDAKTFSAISSKGPVATSRAGNRILANVCKQLMAVIEKNDWRGRWLQHVSDEPIESNMIEYRIIAGMVRKYMPGVPIIDANMETTMDNIELWGAQDIWCPKPNYYEKYREAYEEMRSQGDRVWFYTCLDPRGKYLNRFLDQERMRPMLIGWFAALYDLDGFLHWGLNKYGAFKREGRGISPFERSCKGNLPPGDTHVVYPGANGPWSSTRLEAHRIGFEDYELLKMLKAKDSQQAEEIISKIIRNSGDYTKEPEVYRAVRKELLKSLEK